MGNGKNRRWAILHWILFSLGENLRKNTKSWFQIAPDLSSWRRWWHWCLDSNTSQGPFALVEGSSLWCKDWVGTTGWGHGDGPRMGHWWWTHWMFYRLNILKHIEHIETYWKIPILHNFDPQLFSNSVPQKSAGTGSPLGSGHAPPVWSDACLPTQVPDLSRPTRQQSSAASIAALRRRLGTWCFCTEPQDIFWSSEAAS